jgi:FKBP-type peptidyl-prolyl cis-trans isomerase
MMHRNISVAVIFTITVVCNYAYRPAHVSRGLISRTSLLNNNDDYYNLLNRNENTVASAVTNSLNPYEIDQLNKGLIGTPGFISSVPISTQAQSRKELAKIVVSAAVLYLSLNIRMKEIVGKLDYSDKSEPGANSDTPVIMSTGIQYTDSAPMLAGNDVTDASDLIPRRGDEMILQAKLFYNGLQINKGNANTLLAFQCLDEKKYQEVYSVENLNFKDVPLLGLKEAMSGLKYNTKRKAVIPAYLAFGNEGLAPFIPGGAAVMYELILAKKQ